MSAREVPKRHRRSDSSLDLRFSPYPATKLNHLMVRPDPRIVQNQEAPSKSKDMTAHTGKSSEPQARSESEQITTHTEKSNEPKVPKGVVCLQVDHSSLAVDFSRYPATNPRTCPNPLMVVPDSIVVPNQQAPSECEQMTSNSEEINKPKWCSISGFVNGEAQKMGADIAHVLNKHEERDLAQKTVAYTASTLSEDDDCSTDVEDDNCSTDVEDDIYGNNVEDDMWGFEGYEEEFKLSLAISKERLHEDEKEVEVFNKNFKKYVRNQLASEKISCKLEWGEGNEGQITVELCTRDRSFYMRDVYYKGVDAIYALHYGLSTRDARKIIRGEYKLGFFPVYVEDNFYDKFKSFFGKEAVANNLSCRVVSCEVNRIVVMYEPGTFSDVAHIIALYLCSL